MPETAIGRAGKPYRPDGVMEAIAFLKRFCFCCEMFSKDAALSSPTCEILDAVKRLDVDDGEYPPEWVYGICGEKTCTAFKKKDDDNG